MRLVWYQKLPLTPFVLEMAIFLKIFLTKQKMKNDFVTAIQLQIDPSLALPVSFTYLEPKELTNS
jgi:hypothetical protein